MRRFQQYVRKATMIKYWLQIRKEHTSEYCNIWYPSTWSWPCLEERFYGQQLDTSIVFNSTWLTACYGTLSKTSSIIRNMNIAWFNIYMDISSTRHVVSACIVSSFINLFVFCYASERGHPEECLFSYVRNNETFE